jgi:phosphate transport system ATP-binding protein
MAHKIKMAARNLDFYYGSFKALHDITLDIQENRVTALIGPSGCGKSTFLRCLNRMNDLIPGTRVEGELTLDGGNIHAPDVDVVELRRRVGMVFQKPNPFPKTVFENVAYGLRVNGVRDNAFIAQQVEKSCATRRFSTRSRTACTIRPWGCPGASSSACASPGPWPWPGRGAHGRAGLGLDPIATQKIEELVHELKKRFTIIIVTHSMQQAARVRT